MKKIKPFNFKLSVSWLLICLKNMNSKFLISTKLETYFYLESSLGKNYLKI